MTGKVELIGQKDIVIPTYHYADLSIGEGIISEKDTRVNIGNNHYLLITDLGSVFINKKRYWPLYLTGRKAKFDFIAREI